MILSGYTPCNVTFAGATRAAVASNLISILLANGWSSVAGSGTNQTLRSATTPGSQKGQVRIYDPGANNCCQVLGQRASATGTDLGTFWLLPGASTVYRVIANPYWFFCFRADQLPSAREYLHFTVPFCPPGVAAISPDIFCMVGNGYSDTTGSVYSWVNPYASTYPPFCCGSVNEVQQQLIAIGSTNWLSTSQNLPGSINLITATVVAATGSYSAAGTQFHDTSWSVIDSQLQFGTAAASNALSVGWIPDAVILCEQPGPATGAIRNFPTTYGGANHPWYVLTNNNSFFSLALLVG